MRTPMALFDGPENNLYNFWQLRMISKNIQKNS